MMIELINFRYYTEVIMARVLAGLEPERVFYFFEEICSVPHGSGNEKALSDKLVQFARDRGLKVFQDKANNVYISKPATSGLENKKAVMLQAHMDMVAVCTPDSNIDMTKEPVKIYVDGNNVRAKDTSLGADDGTGVAMILALLDSKDTPHPALQAIFTTSEEVGLVGASQLDPNLFESEYLINLDGGDNKEYLSVSCAGSSTIIYTIDKENQPLDKADKKAYKLVIGGLVTGHSAMTASTYGANAIILLAECFSELAGVCPFDIAKVDGGTKMNAQPKDAWAILVVDEKDAAAFENAVKKLETNYKADYLEFCPNLFIKAEPADLPDTVMSRPAADKLTALIDTVPNWAFKYFAPDKKATKVSSNAGILTDDGEKIELTCMLRSNSDFLHFQYVRKMTRFSDMMGIPHRIENQSMAWEYDPDAVLPKLYSDLIEKETGKRPVPVMMHGGVEPGTIIALANSVGKKLSAICMGASGSGAHSTEETLKIDSVGPAYDWMVKVINSLD